jgi:hypothetical protein
MRRRAFLACLAFTAFASGTLNDDFDAAEWKRDISDGYLPYGKLAYEQFPVSDGYPTPHLIQTTGFLHYSFRAQIVQQEGRFLARISEISVRSGFDQNRSWKKTSFTEKKALLAHEQGHLDINELHAADFSRAKKPDGLGANPKAALEDLSAKLEAISDACGDQARLEQDKYDVETKHGAEPVKQKEWFDAIRKRFASLGIDYWDKR